MTGAEIFVRSLIEENVEVVFGYPGGATIGIYDVLHDISDIKHVLTRHEQGATHAAEGYAKAMGKAGVVLATSGPGGTNTVTGIADAYMDSIPIVVFTGQVALAPHRQRCVPGSGHRRHYPADHQTLLPGP